MLRQRLLAIIVLLPIGMVFVMAGGAWFVGFICLILGAAAWEFWRMFQQGGFAPSAPILIGGTALLPLARVYPQVLPPDVLFLVVVLAAMTWHVFSYERGQEHAATDFCITLGGVAYLGWLGSYLAALRAIPNGLYWFMLALPAVWLADTGAYVIGRRWGRHRMAPRVSPKKSWEGYFGGVLFAIIGSAGMGALGHLTVPAITAFNGAVMGGVLSVLAPMGDLGESMIKRQFGVKDSSRLIPGHGGIMDRIDSWIWAAAIGFYLIIWFWK